MKNVLYVCLILLILAVVGYAAYGDSVNRTEVGSINSMPNTITVYTRPSGTTIVHIGRAHLVLDSRSSVQLKDYLTTFINVADTANNENVTVKWRRPLGSVAAGSHTIWMQVDVNIADQPRLLGTIVTNADPNFVSFTLTEDEASQLLSLLTKSGETSDDLQQQIAVLNNALRN